MLLREWSDKGDSLQLLNGQRKEGFTLIAKAVKRICRRFVLSNLQDSVNVILQ